MVDKLHLQSTTDHTALLKTQNVSFYRKMDESEIYVNIRMLPTLGAHFSILSLLISSLLHHPDCDVEIDLSVSF